ncbi:glycosyltransferase family 29 protein [Streptomyces sp. NBC_00140]|uniref:glycosyltransferase family 29 protein n=1 Tax=Streptomyces sp. NBC_00140 TaxID=2975664 RepID=UPI00225B70D5|nr:glycosyltransferase family 29 protein [Streptomyces sp. NBC_00140]MCX5331831.1 glycosyltransferase family 29 protein [Streptomyces sp. NBC_00140]
MTTVQKRRARARGGELDDCLRACAVHSGKVVGSIDRRRVELAEQLRKLLVVWGTTATSAPVPAPAGGATALLKRAVKGAATPASAIPGELLDALLAVANKALECGYDDELDLALVISDTVLAQRKNSRAGWRLRARLLEALGEETEAVEAYEKYLALTDDDGFGVRAKIAGLRVAGDKERELLALLKRQSPRAAEFTRRAATDVWAEGLAAHAVGDWTEAEPRLVGALLTLAAEDAPVADRQELLSQYLDLRTTESTDLASLTEALALYAEQRRNRMRGPVADPTIGGVQWIGLGEFRNRIAGKSICLIANSGRVGASSMGSDIDAYDLVVRFNSYKIDPKHTGSRTDIHATIHKHGFNWDRQVDTRLVFGGISGDWKYSLRNRLVPGAQTFLGDESLRWPVRNIGKLGTDVWSGIPTTGFNMLYLLDFLDVSPTLDLIGFDFYESGAYRVQEAMKLAITSVHEYTSEKAWVMQRAQSVTDMRISLR